MKQVNLTPTQWASFPDVNDVAPIGDDDELVLHEIREVLVRHGKVDRFGVTLVHRHFGLAEGEIIFEETDPDGRTQTMNVRSEDFLRQRENVLPTQWVFNRPGFAVACHGYCDYQNGGHSNRHKLVPNISE